MRRLDWILLAVFIAPFFVALGDSSIWDANEAFYTQTPREMIAAGNWVSPRFNGQPRLNKPPLSYWIVAAFYEVFGVSVYWERVAMALLAAGSILAVFKLGATLFDADTALLAAGIFATTFRFAILSRRLLIDILLLFCLLAAIAFLAEWMRSGRRSRFLLAVAFTGLGFLAKGPLAFFPPALLFLYLALTRQSTRWKQAPLASSALLLAALCLPWFVALGFQSGWSSVANFFLRENLGRFTSLDYGPQRGVFYYVGVFVADFFPWSVFFMASCVWWVRSRRKDASPEERQTACLLFLWIGIWFVLFSLSHNKQEYYILPLYPVAALWTAHYLRGGSPARLLWLVPGIVLAVVAAGLFLVGGRLFPAAPGLWLPPVVLLSFPVWMAKRNWLAGAASLSLFFGVGFVAYLSPLEAYRPVAPLARAVLSLEADQGRELAAGYYRFTAPSLAFYLNRPIAEIYDLQQAATFLDTRPFSVLIVEQRDFAQLQTATETTLHVVESRPILSTNSRTLLAALRSNRPLTPAAWTREILLVSGEKP